MCTCHLVFERITQNSVYLYINKYACVCFLEKQDAWQVEKKIHAREQGGSYPLCPDVVYTESKINSRLAIHPVQNIRISLRTNISYGT